MTERLWDNLSPSEKARAMEDLIGSLGWRIVREVLQDQCDLRATIILVEDLHPDELYKREFLRGERTGIELAYRTVETMAAEARVELENFIKESENVPQQI